MPAENGKPENIATTVTEVSERVTLLIREEIELAKAEVTHKAKRLAVGLGVGAAAGVFGIFALIYLLATLAWGLASLVGHVWLGFAIVLVGLVALSVAGGWFAYGKLKTGPPMPTMAISEAQRIRETVSNRGEIKR